jgi:hypothetical protein
VTRLRDSGPRGRSRLLVGPAACSSSILEASDPGERMGATWKILEVDKYIGGSGRRGMGSWMRRVSRHLRPMPSLLTAPCSATEPRRCCGLESCVRGCACQWVRWPRSPAMASKAICRIVGGGGVRPRACLRTGRQRRTRSRQICARRSGASCPPVELILQRTSLGNSSVASEYDRPRDRQRGESQATA